MISPSQLTRALCCVAAFSLTCLTACQVKQELAPLAVAFDPNKPVNPAGIAADSPAHLCSAETRLYLQFDGMAQWRQSRAGDPLVEHLWSAIAEIRPKGMWDAAAANLGLDENALTDRYFGQCMAIVGEGVSTNVPYAIISRVSPTDLAALPTAMRLKPDRGPQMERIIRKGDAPSPRTAPFTVLSSSDDQLLFATHGQWLIVGPGKYRDHFIATVAYAASRLEVDDGGLPARLAAMFPGLMNDRHNAPQHHRRMGPTLVEDDDFQKLALKLPRDPTVYFYSRDRARKGRHAAAITMKGPQFVAHYAGTIDKIDELYEQFGHGTEIDFGIIPQSTISAASVNLVKRDTKGLSALNVFVFPQNIREHVLPKLAAPIVVFLGKVDGDKIDPNPGVSVPAAGFAIRMRDPAVLNNLNRIMGGMRFLANVSELNVIGGVFGGKVVTSDGLTYRIADFGDALVKQIRDPESARMFKLPDAAGLTKLTYGRIGDWFVVCTQESLYKECAAAHADPARRFTSSAGFESFPFEMRQGLIMSALTRAPELAAMTSELNQYWEAMEAKANPHRKPAVPAVTQRIEGAEETDGEIDQGKRSADEGAATGKPATEGAQKIRQPMEWIANAIKHRDSFYLQVWRDPDGDLRGFLSTVESSAGTGHTGPGP